MKINKLKKISINKSTFALILVLSFAISMIAVLPNAAGEISKPDRETGAFISVNPTVIGVGQPLTVNAWIYPSPNGPNFEMGSALKGAGGVQGLHFDGVTCTFTKPDGSTETMSPLNGSHEPLGLVAGQTEEVGTTWFLYYPTKVGTWSVTFSFPGQTYTYLGYTVKYLPSTSRAVTFTVQQDPVQIGLPPVSLPTGYWSRPINSNNREWWQISGNWIGRYIVSGYNPYATAPNSPHILWKTPVAQGGIIGGEWNSISWGAGGGTPGTIIDGKVYYTKAVATGTNIVCVDLRTGKLIWERDGSFTDGQIAVPLASSTQEFSGSPVPYLWYYSATNGWTRYNAWSGALVNNFTTNIVSLGNPSWLSDDIGYLLRQGAWNGTTLRRPFNFLIKWNMSKVTGTNWLTGVVWNISLKQSDGTGPGEGSRGSAIKILPADNIVVVSTIGESVYYAYDLNTGAQKWVHDIGFTQMQSIWTPDGNLCCYDSSDRMTMHCWDVSTWTELWATPLGVWPWDSNLSNPNVVMAYGNAYFGSYSGHLFCVDLATGRIEWTFFNGPTSETPFGSWADYRGMITADGKIYLGTSEHTPTQPRTRGNQMFCIDAYTGQQLWNISGALSGQSIADGYLISNSNEYDAIMYCMGKGQTATTVTATPKAATSGSSVLIEGTVMDQSPAQAGTPAISDADMSTWMNYMHMQLPANGVAPNVNGVPVQVMAMASDGSISNIGTATSDVMGYFQFAWTPSAQGTYKIIAQFAGSNSYWSSSAETGVSVGPAATVAPTQTPAPTPIVAAPEKAPDNTPMFAAIIVAVLVAIIIGIVNLFALRKRS